MRRLALLCGAAVALVACARTDTASTDSSAAAAAAAMMPAPISLADVAGKWSVRVTPEMGDSTLLTYELTATADMNGWTVKLPDRPDPIPARVTAVAGDSITVEAGPYPSMLRPGVTVSTYSVSRLTGGRFVGTTTARYSVTTADSVLRLRTEGTRIP
jgi:hypothetical protein